MLDFLRLLCTFRRVTVVSLSKFVSDSSVCLFFIVAAHKSYRVSVTVATVKRTNSVQEYLTTVFITIQFSRCLLLLALTGSRCSTHSSLCVLFVPVFRIFYLSLAFCPFL